MRTKVIVTYGPSIERLNVLRSVINEGVDIVRLNSKYVEAKEFDLIRKKVVKAGNVKIMIDVKDRGKIKDWVSKKIDYLAISFAESAVEVVKIKKMFLKRVKVISKIETKKGVSNIDRLIRVSDGVMIARGDLGHDVSFEKVPMIQKMITKKCNKKKKMSITATEMMSSMVSYIRPSRAEVSDVANAILEGSEALMLAEETAVGRHPILAVKAMIKVILETEKHMKEFR